MLCYIWRKNLESAKKNLSEIYIKKSAKKLSKNCIFS